MSKDIIDTTTNNMYIEETTTNNMYKIETTTNEIDNTMSIYNNSLLNKRLESNPYIDLQEGSSKYEDSKKHYLSSGLVFSQN